MEINDYYLHQPFLSLCVMLGVFGLMLFALRWFPIPKLTRARRWVARAGLLLACVSAGLAIGGVSKSAQRETTAWVIIVDRSPSAQQSAASSLPPVYESLIKKLSRGDSISVVAFDARAEVLLPWTSPEEAPKTLQLPVSTSPAVGNALDLALSLATATAPRESNLKVILLSDGGGAERLSELPQDVVHIPLGFEASKDLALRDFRIRSRSMQSTDGSPITQLSVTLQAWANEANNGTLKIAFQDAENDESVHNQEIVFETGVQEITVNLALPKAPPFTLVATLESPEDTIRGNESLSQSVPRQSSSLSIALVDDDPKFGFAKILTEATVGKGMRITPMRSSSLRSDSSWLDQWDAIVLANVGAASIPSRTQDALAGWARAGGGLAMLGSPKTFGSGGWIGTKVEEVLPVDCDPNSDSEGERVFVVALDVSGSMGMSVGNEGMSKMDHANHGAGLALRMMADFDRFGAIASGSHDEWIVRIGELTHRDEVLEDLGANSAGGGGIYIDQAVNTALRALNDEAFTKRYLLIFGDGVDTTLRAENNDKLEREAWIKDASKRLKEAGVEVSCVSIGGGRDADFMEAFCKAADGQFFVTNNAEELPVLFSTAAAGMLGGFILEGNVRVASTSKGSLTSGIDHSEAASLLGIIATTAKKDATVWLTGEIDKEFPLLATRRVGIGRTLAFTSDATNLWAAPWLEWGGYSRSWQRWLRWLGEGSGWPGAAEISINAEGILTLTHDDVGKQSVHGLYRADNGININTRMDRLDEGESAWRLPKIARKGGRFTFWSEGANDHVEAIGEAFVHQTNISEGWRDPDSGLYLQSMVTAAKGTTLSPVSTSSGESVLPPSVFEVTKQPRRHNDLRPALLFLLAGLFALVFSRRFPTMFRSESQEKGAMAIATVRRLSASVKTLPRANEPKVGQSPANLVSQQRSQGIDFSRLRDAKDRGRSGK